MLNNFFNNVKTFTKKIVLQISMKRKNKSKVMKYSYAIINELLFLTLFKNVLKFLNPLKTPLLLHFHLIINYSISTIQNQLNLHTFIFADAKK